MICFCTVMLWSHTRPTSLFYFVEFWDTEFLSNAGICSIVSYLIVPQNTLNCNAYCLTEKLPKKLKAAFQLILCIRGFSLISKQE